MNKKGRLVLSYVLNFPWYNVAPSLYCFHLQARMRRFFIGGTPELEDIRYVGNTDTQAALAVLLTLTYF